MALNLTAGSFKDALKLLYPNGLAEVMYPDVPFVGWVNKDKEFYGEAKVVVPFIGGTQGSADFSTANTNKGDITIKKFLVTRVKDYAIATVDAETLMATKNDKGAVARALDSQIKGAMYELSRSAGAQVYGDATGKRATVTATSGATITVSRTDVVNFELGMHCDLYDDSAAGLAAGNSDNYIIAIDRDSGVLTFNDTVATVFSATPEAGADYLVREGDYNSSAAGLLGWLPTTAPTSGDSFFSLDRSDDPVRLAGIRFVGTSSLLEETLMDACAYAHINGARPDTLFINPLRFAQLAKSQLAKTVVDVKTDIPGIGYKGLKIPTSTGVITVIPDPNCPYANGFLLQKSTWKLCSLGPFPHFAMDDGLKMQREASADAVTFRIRAYWNLLCDKPGKNMVITW